MKELSKILLSRRSSRRSTENSLNWMIKLDPLKIVNPGTPPPLWRIDYLVWVGGVLSEYANFSLEKPNSLDDITEDVKATETLIGYSLCWSFVIIFCSGNQVVHPLKDVYNSHFLFSQVHRV
jgi:hypothetical protein